VKQVFPNLPPASVENKNKTLNRTTAFRAGPSTPHHPCSAQDREPSNGDPPQCQAEEPSTSDRERPCPMPILFGFATYFVPLMIGARDMAFQGEIMR
jgi:hypothetical protein